MQFQISFDHPARDQGQIEQVLTVNGVIVQPSDRIAVGRFTAEASWGGDADSLEAKIKGMLDPIWNIEIVALTEADTGGAQFGERPPDSAASGAEGDPPAPPEPPTAPGATRQGES